MVIKLITCGEKLIPTSILDIVENFVFLLMKQNQFGMMRKNGNSEKPP